MSAVAAVPVRLEKLDPATLGVHWSDGRLSRFPVRFLRERCPCAVCVDEVTGARRLDPARLPPEVRPRRILPVGRYALQIEWSDGHATGLYTFAYLAELDRELRGGAAS